MNIGVPKEIKTGEHRVALTPAGASRLVSAGHKVVVQASAGEGSGFNDRQYVAAGASVELEPAQIWASADLVIKVKEPVEPELGYIAKRGTDLTLFTYLHLAGVPGLATALSEAGTTAIAYETVRTADGHFPLLAPMSEVAGQLAVHAGAEYLRRPQGTKGVLISGGPGIPPAKVAVIGAGVVGQSAARLAMAMGATVTLLNRSSGKLRQFAAYGYPGSLVTEIASPDTVAEVVSESDVVIGAVYVAGARAQHVVTREMIGSMERGSVVVDVSIDQGGCFETSHATTFDDPVFIVDDVVHYCVANMPGSVPRTSTLALTNETIPYVLALASAGVENAVRKDAALAKGVNVYRGTITDEAVAVATGLEHRSLAELL